MHGPDPVDGGPGRCRRFGPRRIDCEDAPGRDCFQFISTSLDRRGELRLGRYGAEDCSGGLRRHPKWEFHDPHVLDVPLLGEPTWLCC
jgi:hypothetical protein